MKLQVIDEGAKADVACGNTSIGDGGNVSVDQMNTHVLTRLRK